MKKILALVMIIMILVLGLSIEREVSSFQEENKYNGYINYNMVSNPDNLKQTNNVNVREKDLLANLFEGLVKENESGVIEGALAKSFNVSEDGLEYEFILREDIYYSSGEKILPDDFVSFFKSFLEDEENIYRSDLDCIYGAKDFREGKNDFSKVAIRAKDNSVVIRLNYPCPYLLNILANPIYTLRDYNELEQYKNNYKGIRFTGPFIINEAFKEYIIITKNSKYYDHKDIYESPIRISFIESSESALAVLEEENNNVNSKVDLMLDVPVNEIYRLNKLKLIESFDGDTLINIRFNVDNGKIFNDIEARRFISNLINRDNICKSISSKLLKPAYTTTPALEEVYEKTDSQNHDIDKSYFDKITTEDKLQISVLYEENSLQRRLAKEFCKYLYKETGVEFIPKGYSRAELEKLKESKEYDIFLEAFKFQYDYEKEYYEYILTFFQDDSSLIKDIINDIRFKVNKQERINELYKCEEILKNEKLIIPLYKVNNVVCRKENIKGIYVTNFGNIILSKLKISL